jgi:hypothetical protein
LEFASRGADVDDVEFLSDELGASDVGAEGAVWATAKKLQAQNNIDCKLR